MSGAEYQRKRYRERKTAAEVERVSRGQPVKRPYIIRWTDEVLTEPWAVYSARRKAERAARKNNRAS